MQDVTVIPQADRRALAIHVAELISDYLVDQEVYTHDQGALLFDRLTDALENESISTLIQLLPHKGA